MTRGRTWTALGLLLAATALAYLPSIDGEFVLDDFTVVSDPLVVAPLDHGLADWLASPRPILAATFALNHATVGLDSRSWHLGNLLVHMAAVVLAWRLARRLLVRAGLDRPDGPALVVAGLFALHPLQTEAVSYVAQRGEALASAFYVAALLVLLGRDGASSALRRWSLLGASAALLAAGLLVKPIGVTLPLAWLLAAAFLPPGAERADPAARRVIRRLPAAAPLLALAAAAALWGLSAAAGSGHAGLDMPGVSPWAYLTTQLRVIPVYLARFAWPAGQCADCFIPWSDGLLDPAALVGGAFLAALAGTGAWLAWSARDATGDGAAVRRLAGFGILFFFLMLVPTSTVVPLRDPLVEHRVYLALLGLLTFAVAASAAALRALVPARAPVVGATIALAVLAAAGLATARRNAVWATALAFHQDAAAKAPQKARVHLNLGVALMRARRFEEAVASFRRAHALEADRTVSPRQVFDYLQAALLNAGQVDEARRTMLEALMADADDPWALANLAEVEFVSGRVPSAVEAARVALLHEPGNVKALKYLGLALAAQGDTAGAVVPLRSAAASSNEPGVHAALGLLEERLGDRAAACRALARSAQLSAGLGMAPSAAQDLRRLGCR